MQRQTLQPWDYMVISAVMALSVAIGFYFRFAGNRKQTKAEFLMGGRNMNRFPVVFSLVVSKLSAVALIGEPSEVYQYGTQRCIMYILIIVGSYVTAYVYLPVYFAVGASTIHRYLELRFGKHTRNLVSILCYIQILLYMGVVLYAPAIALNAVTNLTTETSIILMGLVCILFSSTGGFRGILWTDVFQAFFMYVCLIIVLVSGTIEAGGPLNVYHSAQKGMRFELWNFSLDPGIRYTFWNSIAFGVHIGVAIHTVNQVEVQRLLSIRDLKKSQSALLWSSIPSFSLHIMASCVGLVMYAVFSNCDPVSKDSGIGLTKADQLVPYFIVSRLSVYPGLAGLCVSGIFSGAMTSVSSAVNSLSVVVLDDFLLPNISPATAKRLQLGLLAKCLVVGHGVLIMSVAFFVSAFNSVVQGVVVLNGMIMGPALGLFSLGMLTRGTNEMGGILGVMSGVLLSGCIGIGSSFAGVNHKSLPLSTTGCYVTSGINDTVSCLQCFNETTDIRSTEDIHQVTAGEPFVLYRVSFMWISFIGMMTSLVVGYSASRLISICTKTRILDPRVLSPVVKCCDVQSSPFELVLLRTSN